MNSRRTEAAITRVAPWVAVFALPLALNVPAPADPDAYQLYARARAVWLSQHYPASIAYTIAVAVDDHGVVKTNHYKAFYDSTRANIDVDPVSVEEHNDPHTPSGVNMSIRPKRNFQTIFVKPVGRPEDAVDFLGVPHLAPNYSFGIAPQIVAANDQSDAAKRAALVRAIREQYNDPMSQQKNQQLEKTEPLKEIANVATSNRNYVVTFAGMEYLNGRDMYHLSLRPVHSPLRLRLRELWVDTQTFATSQLVTEGNFNRFGSVPWTVTFQNIDGAQYIASESANSTVTVGLHTYRSATITFESIAIGQKPPSLMKPFMPVNNMLEEPSM